jgi:hypothetical protein
MRRAGLVLWVTFFVLLAPSGPLDVLGPYRGFWQRNFLVKPNHVLAIVLVPLVLWLLAGRWSKRRGLLTVAVLAAVGWVFVVPWALVGWGLFIYIVGLAVRRPLKWKSSAMRTILVGVSSVVLVSPLLYYLIKTFPVLHFAPGAFPEDPLRSVWGDRLSPTHSLFFLVTLDLGLNFFLALYGMWTARRSDNRFQHMWLSLAIGGYIAWSANIVLLYVGQARESDELYYFVVFHTAVFAGLGMAKLVDASAQRFSWNRARLTAVVLLFLFPMTTVWWWDPPETDTHFRIALKPVPERLFELGEWLRQNSRGSDIVLTGTQTALWVPAVSGRRVLRTGIYEPGTDLYRDERAILFPRTIEEGRQVLRKTGVDLLIYDPSLASEHQLESEHLDRHPLFERVHVSGPYRIYRPTTDPDP